MNRALLAPIGLVLLLVLTGCMGPFGGIAEDRLAENATYDFDTTANATYTVTTNGSYQVVYNVSGQESMEFYRTDGLGSERSLPISAVQFRTPNGTTYGHEQIEVSTNRRRTTVTFPASEGKFAYTSPSSPKQFNTRVFVEGSHEVVLPAGRSLDNPLFGHVQPRADNVTRVDGRLHLRWSEMDAQRIVVRYYMDRDVTLLGGLVLVAGTAALIGIAYYYRLIRQLEHKREEAGLDLDGEDS